MPDVTQSMNTATPPTELAEAAFFFNARAGHRLVLPAEFDELLGFADAVELKLAGTTGLAFVVAIRLRHRESEWASDWVRCLYVPSRDPARPRPLEVREGWQLPPCACRLELAVDGTPGGVRRTCVVPAEFAAHLNSRVRRAVGADSFIGQMRQTLYILGRITADQIDRLQTHESAVVELSKA